MGPRVTYGGWEYPDPIQYRSCYCCGRKYKADGSEFRLFIADHKSGNWWRRMCDWTDRVIKPILDITLWCISTFVAMGVGGIAAYLTTNSGTWATGFCWGVITVFAILAGCASADQVMNTLNKEQ
jgi:hypothetical protein